MVSDDKPNLFHFVLGARSYGKTTLATHLALEFQAQWGAYVLAHDTRERIRGQLVRVELARHHENGAPIYRTVIIGEEKVRAHRTLGELKGSLMTDPGGIHTVATPTADPLCRYAIELARLAQQEQKGDPSPVLLWINESTACLGVSTRRRLLGGKRTDETEPWQYDPIGWLASQGRHEYVGVIIESQSARLLSGTIMGELTGVSIFYTQDQLALDKLQYEAGVDEELIEAVMDLEKHEFVRWEID